MRAPRFGFIFVRIHFKLGPSAGLLRQKVRSDGFTLVEMLVSIAVLTLIIFILFSITQQAAKVLTSSNGKIESFQAARDAFESMTRNIGLATLNNYYDYVNASGQTIGQFMMATPTGTFVPSISTSYQRASDLHFICGDYTTTGLTVSSQQVKNTDAIFFQAPLGYSQNTSYRYLDRLLNACGYYVQYGSDAAPSPLFNTPARYRYQLMEFIQPSENLGVYQTSVTNNSKIWYNGAGILSGTNIHTIADNIVALVILPLTPSADTGTTTSTGTAEIAPNFNYDSRSPIATAAQVNQLPPVVEVTMVAIDEASALKLGNSSTETGIIRTALNSNDSQGAALFTVADNLQIDIKQFENCLGAVAGNPANNSIPLNYRVFETQIAMRSANF